VGRWLSIGACASLSAAATPFVSSDPARFGLITLAALSTLVLAYWGAKSDARLEEAHAKILEQARQIEAAAALAVAAHEQAHKPIYERRNEEYEELIVKPIEDHVRRLVQGGLRFLGVRPSGPQP
jgi:cobalamin biosynthesis Mg chelatase CobN